MNRSHEIEIKVGIFVALGIGLCMLCIVLLGGGQSILERNETFHARFNQIEGLVEGAMVKIAGVKVGQVSSIHFQKEANKVDVVFSVVRKYQDAVHTDSTVGIQTQGMLGDRYLVVNPGSIGSPVAANNTELKVEAPKELKDYLSDADEVIGKLKDSLESMDTILGNFRRDGRSDQFFRNLAGFSSHVNEGTKHLGDSMSHFNSVMAKIDRGDGTIGALVNDPALYDDVRALLGGANRNRVLKYFIKKSVEESRDSAKDQKK